MLKNNFQLFKKIIFKFFPFYKNKDLKLVFKILNKGFSKDKQRVSTHPYFEDRILLIKNFEKNKENNFNKSYNQRFNYIRAKFIGYSDNEEVLSELNEPFKAYAESIKLASSGNLKMSLQNLNEIIIS